MKLPHPGLVKEPIDVHRMPKDHKSRSGWRIKAAKKKPYNVFGVLFVGKKTSCLDP